MSPTLLPAFFIIFIINLLLKKVTSDESTHHTLIGAVDYCSNRTT